MKPDIVFFGEQLPPKFYMYLADVPKADLLIVMGTSLEVCMFMILKYIYEMLLCFFPGLCGASHKFVNSH